MSTLSELVKTSTSTATATASEISKTCISDFSIPTMSFIVIIPLLDYLYCTITDKLDRRRWKISNYGLLLFNLILFIAYYTFIVSENNYSLSRAFILGMIIWGSINFSNLAQNKPNNINPFIDTIWGGLLFIITTIIYKSIKKI